MFITRKKLDAMIEQAKVDVATEHDRREWVNRRMEDMERQLYRMSEQVCRLQQELEKHTGQEILDGSPRAIKG